MKRRRKDNERTAEKRVRWKTRQHKEGTAKHIRDGIDRAKQEKRQKKNTYYKRGKGGITDRMLNESERDLEK